MEQTTKMQPDAGSPVTLRAGRAVRPPAVAGRGRQPAGGLARVAKFAAVRLVILALMVAIGIFLAVVVVNLGGYIDKIFRANIEDALMGMSMGGAFSDLSPTEASARMAEIRWQMEEEIGLHEPFLGRCVRWWWHALTFDWGESRGYSVRTLYSMASAQAHDTRVIILQRIPNTLLLAGAANLLLFFGSVAVALPLSKRYGSVTDKVMIALSPISSIPNWVYGILLTVVFAAELRLLPYSGMFDTLPPPTKIGYVPIVLKHMVLPVTAILLSGFFQSVYTWRTFFLIHAGEDYVELARAKGLPRRMLDHRYLVRPTLPYLITSFALMLIGFWQGVLVLEKFFRWPGIGALFLTAVQTNTREVTVGVLVLFAILLAISVFLLDFFYAAVDPRVRIGGSGERLRPVRRGRLLRLWTGRLRSLRRIAPPTDPGGTTRTVSEGTTHKEMESTVLGGRGQRGARARGSRGRPWRGAGDTWGSLRPALGELRRYPSAIVGILLILGLAAMAAYAVVALPYDEAVEAWRPEREGKYLLPKLALPRWVNALRRDKLPETIVADSREGTAQKTVESLGNGLTQVTIVQTLDYSCADFPQDLTIIFATQSVKRPHVTITWFTPDGRTFDLGNLSVVSGQIWLLSQEMPRKYLTPAMRENLTPRGSGGLPAITLLLSAPGEGEHRVLKGTYTLRIEGTLFEEGDRLDAQIVMPGEVYGWAGTDDQRRDIGVALLSGAPVALIFGLLGAVVTSVASMTIAALGAWYGGWVDEVLQRITEIDMILPALPIAIMVFYLYSHSIWAILGVIVLLNVFGSSVKTYRAAFLQVKEAPYIEAALAYGAGNARMVGRYLVPRIVPLLIPQLVILIPTYVFFEATLGFLGISDPRLPTWGKLVYEALTKGAFEGHYHWVLEPTGLMVLTGLAFAMVGFALDSILNPRLRSR